MKFSKNLYLSNSIRHLSRIKWRLRTGRGQLNIYLLTISNSSDQLDCFHNALLKQRFFRQQPLMVVGIAADYSEAIMLIEQITQEVYDKTGCADIKKYLLQYF